MFYLHGFNKTAVFAPCFQLHPAHTFHHEKPPD